VTLFDPGPALAPATADDHSADVRRRKRNERLLAIGVHPATRRPLAGNGGTCGDCEHSYRTGLGHRGWWKCELVPATNGPGTDIRLKWPACASWQHAATT
jgi:hypothetical protein